MNWLDSVEALNEIWMLRKNQLRNLTRIALRKSLNLAAKQTPLQKILAREYAAIYILGPGILIFLRPVLFLSYKWPVALAPSLTARIQYLQLQLLRSE